MPTDLDSRTPRIAAYLRANIVEGGGGREGVFTIQHDRDDANIYRNYAVPDDGSEPDDAAVAGLIALFVELNRTPRLEYIPELAPALLSRLEAGGFRIERETPLLSCSPSVLPAPYPIGLEWPAAEDLAGLEEAARIQNEAFGATETTQSDVERLRQMVLRGGAVALIRDAETGAGLGSGVFTPPIASVAEIAAVAVRAAARGRGIGSSLAASLGRRAIEQGVDCPFLMASPEDEKGIYRRAGYTSFGRVLHISIPR
ncbi:GNAT family N-acetyltransferase [Paludisphaera mucosa]|uniref:GNAT family N-acetyltransferase n=1 Tax=Paludisphaera mucosa TaxID=3030827 RepID=A0ABT6F838_9BACT|nr:GNAT family N-acetyltransferase [Paludisphaera mucosa]MDG3003744.1 GNAT family N-acetyltransferase [Paludisphaera mucosa]